jgi:Zn-dependent protease with chaperone function
MLNLAKLFNLCLHLLLVAACVTSIAYSLEEFEFLGIPDFNIAAMMDHMQWGVATIMMVFIVSTSPLADILVSLCIPARKITLRETARINQAKALVEAHYEKHFGRTLRLKVKVQDMPHLQGLCFGRKTVVITTGLLKTATDDELVAIIAHEVGHLHFKEGMMNLILVNSFMLLYWITNILMLGALSDRNPQESETASAWEELYPLLGFVLIWIICHFPYHFLLCIMGITIVWLIQFTDFCTNWQCEYRADRIAVQLGFSVGLISFLERIEAQDMRDKQGFLSNFRYSHPPTSLRIDKVERYIAQHQ